MPSIHLLDYVAGNIRSLVNAIEKLGYTVQWIKTPADIAEAEVCIISRLLFPQSKISINSIPPHILIILPDSNPPWRRPLRALHNPTLSWRLH